jgi:hypothetical protein
MPTICPNCLRPVRIDAKYCGFCGTNLKPTPKDETAVAITTPEKSEATIENPTTVKQIQPKGSKIRRIVLIILIILLCLVLLMAFSLHYWPVLGPYINAVLSLLRPR